MKNPILLDFPDSFETERLFIRAPRAGDGAIVNAAIKASIEELLPWMPWAKRDIPVEETEASHREAYAKWILRTDLRLLVFKKHDGALVASSGLHRIDWSIPRFEIGYWQNTPYCGQGFMTEAVIGITHFALETLGAQRLEIQCDARNEKSRRVAERAGYTLEAVLKNNGRNADGTLNDLMVFVRFPEETQ